MPGNIIRCTFGYECNDKCIYCTLSTKGHKRQPLKSSDIPKLIEKISAMGDADVEISGGEPTLRPETFYFLEQMHETCPRARCTILTNGRLFSKANIASRISNTPPHKLVIPLHADIPQIHDAITQVNGSFSETMLGIKNLYEYNLPASLKIVVSKQNYMRLPQLVDLLAQKFPECTGLIANRVIFNSGKSLENKALAAVRLTETVPYVEKAIDRGKKYGFRVWIYCLPPCMLSDEYNKYLGPRYPQELMGDIFNGNIARTENNHQPEKCKGCKHSAECGTTWNSYFETYGTDEIKPIK